jgi:hypothetical protein
MIDYNGLLYHMFGPSCSFTHAPSPTDLDPDSSQHMKTKQQLFYEQKNLSESQITPWSFNRIAHIEYSLCSTVPSL